MNIIKRKKEKIKEFFEKKRVQELKDRYDAGYNWAAGELLKGKPTELPESYVECSRHFDDYNKFDEGIEDAVMDWSKLIKLK